MKLFILFLSLFTFSVSQGQVEDYYKSNKTPTYDEVISFYKDLAAKEESAKLLSYGMTDAGLPLHLFVLDADQQFEPDPQRPMLLIMNAIHAGEPCGVDASINFAKDLLSWNNLPDETIIGIIPIYNVGGALNRNSYSRANQNGPEEHGFRGNAKNLDLNRDFIKNDSKNAQSFAKIFHEWNPHLFIDTHTSNGADYRYTFTLISPQKDKINPVLEPFIQNDILPFLFKGMKEKGYEMTPYVYSMDKTPDSGIKAFLDRPRYSTGYVALYNTIGFTTEAHMFKPYEDRVEATLAFLHNVKEFSEANVESLLRFKRTANRISANTTTYALDWSLDSTSYQMINFKGYEAAYKKSKLTGANRLYYDRSKPYSKNIPFYNTFKTVAKAKRPKYYIVPQAWSEVIDRLELNEVRMQRLKKDSSMEVTVTKITSFESSSRVYEDHFYHYNIEVEEGIQKVHLRKGDYLIPMGQLADHYVMTALEAKGPDSFFAWNFFDTHLQQKEWYSSYVFEDEAMKILQEDKELSMRFQLKLIEDSAFAASPQAQLYYVYSHSKYYEPEHMRYPVFKLY